MRILLDYRPALRQRSGVGEYVHRLACALTELAPSGGADRPELTIFSSSWKDRLDPAVVPGAASVDRRIPVRLLNLLWHRLGWPPVERLAGTRFDVVHSFHPLLLPSRHAARLVTVHDLDFLDHPERTRAEVRRDYRSLAPAHVRRADRVIANSAHTAGEVARRLGVEPERITVCTPGAPDWQPRRSAPAGGYLLFVGTLEPRKNVGALLDAYCALLERTAGLPDLVLAGRATPAAADWLRRIAEPPLRGHCRARGYVAEGELRALYEGARVLVVPSHHEGFGMTALEGMSLGVPVVAADRGAVPEVVGEAGLLVEPTVSGLAEGISRLLADGELAGRLSELGPRQAARFSWKASAAALLGAYAAAIETRQLRATG